MVIMNNLIKNRDEQVSELREKTEKNVEIAMYTRAEVGNKISQIACDLACVRTKRTVRIAAVCGGYCGLGQSSEKRPKATPWTLSAFKPALRRFVTWRSPGSSPWHASYADRCRTLPAPTFARANHAISSKNNVPRAFLE